MLKQSPIIRIKMENPLETKHLESESHSFLVRYQNKVYQIGTHHYNPIAEVYTSNNNKLKVLIDCPWADMIVLEPDDDTIHNYEIYDINDENYKLPQERDAKLVLKTSKEDYELTFKNCFQDQLNIFINIKTIYFGAIFNKNLNIPYGLSGSPVFYENKLIGMIVSFNKSDNEGIFIPIYIFYLLMSKREPKKMYQIKKFSVKKYISSINYFEDTFETKYFRNNINNDLIIQVYHPKLGTFVGLETLFLLEGDKNKVFKFCYNNLKNKDYVSEELKKFNETNLKFKKENTRYVKINIRLLMYLYNLLEKLKSEVKTQELPKEKYILKNNFINVLEKYMFDKLQHYIEESKKGNAKSIWFNINLKD
jgi:hypothetical protein